MRILVTAASRHEGTTEMAHILHEVLLLRGHDVVDCQPDDATQIGDVTRFNAFILGSGLYMGAWLKSAATFVESNSEYLQTQPVWLFSSGPLDGKPKESIDPSRVDSLMRKTKAVEHRVFGGRLDHHRLALAERAIVGVVHAPDGDWRDLEQVRGWAHHIADDLDTRGHIPEPLGTHSSN